MCGDTLGGPVVKSLPSNAGRVDSIPGQAVGILHASWPKTNKKQANKQTKKKNTGQKQCYDTFNKRLKMVHIKKKNLIK